MGYNLKLLDGSLGGRWFNLEEILKYWGLSDAEITPIDSVHKSSWDVGGEYILKHNKNTDELVRCFKLFDILSSYCVPIAEYIKTNDGMWTTPDGSYCLMKKIPGNHVELDIEPEMIKEFGHELAKLHLVLSKVESKIECNDNDYINEWYSYIKPGLVDIPDEIIDFIENNFFELYKELPKQLIHRDVHSQNVLFENGKLTGWLDFDLNCRNVRIFDIAYLLGGLLCNKTDDPEKIKQWEILYRDLIENYDKVNPLSEYEKEAIPLMILAIELLFVSFWNVNDNHEYRDDAVKLVKWLYNRYSI